jgi:electron transport complex protein RnfG
VYRALVGIGMLCALLIASVYLFTKPIIAKNRQQAVEQAIFTVLPSATSYQEWKYDSAASEFFFAAHLNQNRQTKNTERNTSELESFYTGYDNQYKLVGIALLAQGRGYQDRILIMYGYAPERQAIVGMQVLESRETPGLGDKIETDADFRKNFVHLDVSLSSETANLRNAIEVTKSGEKSHLWQIDGITGATISSQAIGNMLQQSTEQWLPLLYQNLEQFQYRSQQEEANE